MYRTGFDNDKYLKLQSDIRKRIAEFGVATTNSAANCMSDNHASRVLPRL